MEEHTNDRNHLEITEEHANRLEQLELETKGMVAASKVWIYVIIGLLVYMVFMVIPDIDEKVTWMEKDLNSVLVQSERFKKATKSFCERQSMLILSFESRLSTSQSLVEISKFF